MLTWVVYDITKVRTRTRVAKRCLDFGSTVCRIAFFLAIWREPDRGNSAVQRELLDMETDSVYIFPMCRPDFDQVRIVGQAFDRALVANDLLTKVI